MARKDSGEVRWPHEGGELVEGEAHTFIQGKIHFKVWMFPLYPTRKSYAIKKGVRTKRKDVSFGKGT